MYNQGYGQQGGFGGRPGMGGPGGFGGRPGMGPGMGMGGPGMGMGGPGFGGRPGMGGPGMGMGGPGMGMGGPGYGGPQGGYGGPQGGYGGPQGGYQQQQYNNDDDGEWEYVTDDEGDFLEDENGNIMTPQEAENRGLVRKSDGTTDRGIGKNLLIGGAILGGLWIMNKQLKKKKRVKKINPDNVPYKWVQLTGQIPTNALAFKNSLNKTFVIARGKTNGGVHPGYLNPSNNHLYTSFNGDEVVVREAKDIEILTCPQNRYSWVRCNNTAAIGDKAVAAGYEKDGSVLYVAKVKRDNIDYFGKTSKKAGCAYYGYNQKEFRIPTPEFEVLMYN